jgi:hypothetical protein
MAGLTKQWLKQRRSQRIELDVPVVRAFSAAALVLKGFDSGVN